MRKSLKNNY